MLKPVKLVHVLPHLKIGGVENAALYLLSNLPEQIEYHLVCLEQAEQGLVDSLPKELLGQRLHIINGKRFSPITYFKAYKLMVKLQPEWAMFSLWRSQPLLWVISLFTGISTAFIFHNNRFKHWLDKLSSQLSLRLSDKVCTDSEASQAFIMPLTQKNVSIIHHFIPQAKVPAEKHPKSMVFIGRVAANKGLNTALQLLSLMRKLDNGWRLDIYGPDEGAKAELIALGEQLSLGEHVQFHPALLPNQVPFTLANFSYLVLPSKNEGMAMIVLEAMQQGLIPLVRPVGQIPFYTKNLKSALWLPDEIDTSFALQLQKLDNSPLLKQDMQNNMQQELSEMPSIISDVLSEFSLSISQRSHAQRVAVKPEKGVG
ncbi:glycosyltransferase family 4 protein [Agarivorans sp. MS3-6]